MEASLVAPRRRRRPRSRDVDVQPAEESVENPTGAEVVDEDLVKDLNNFKEKLLEMESKLLTRQMKVNQKRVQAQKDVVDLFDALNDILLRKEVDLKYDINAECDKLDGEIKDDLEKLKKLREPVDKLVDKQRHQTGNVTNEMLRSLHTTTQSKLESSDICSSSDVQLDITVKTDCINMLEELKFGKISTTASDDTEVTEVSERLHAEQEEPESSHGRQEASCEQVSNSGSNHAISDTENYGQTNRDNRSESNFINSFDGDTGTAVASSEQVGPLIAMYGRDYDEEQGSDYSYDSYVESSFSESLDRATDNAASSSEPSAPPLVLLDEEEEEADPPPYWQAIGLSGPNEDTHPVSPPPLNVHSYHDPAPQYCQFDTISSTVRNNTLIVWHSFPIKRQYDMRNPLYVALSWDNQRICVADRNNRKVKFFSQNGDPQTEMNINGEIHDIAFLENCNGESRYIITMPKDRTLLLVAVLQDNSTKLVRKIILNRAGNYYTSICRGPREHTLVGAANKVASSYYTTEKPRVEMFDFRGKVLQEYKGSMTFVGFEYPRSVVVVGDLIAVADWKLNLVAIFLCDGAQIGQYSGTPSSPLMNPLDLSIDAYGNILVVDGENPSIHVISPGGLPIEVMKVPISGSERLQPKLIAFDTVKKDKLAVVRSSGDMAIFTFKDGYKGLRAMELDIHPSAVGESLPYIEGMLPTTIASIGRQRGRQRTPNFYL